MAESLASYSTWTYFPKEATKMDWVKSWSSKSSHWCNLDNIRRCCLGPWTYKLHLDKSFNEHRIDTWIYIALVNWCFGFHFIPENKKGLLLRGNHQESQTTNLPLVDTFSWADILSEHPIIHQSGICFFEFEPFRNKAEIRSFCYSSPEQTSNPSPINVAWKHH